MCYSGKMVPWEDEGGIRDSLGLRCPQMKSRTLISAFSFELCLSGTVALGGVTHSHAHGIILAPFKASVPCSVLFPPPWEQLQGCLKGWPPFCTDYSWCLEAAGWASKSVLAFSLPSGNFRVGDRNQLVWDRSACQQQSPQRSVHLSAALRDSRWIFLDAPGWMK